MLRAAVKGVDEGRVVLGGCCIGVDDPDWCCSECGLMMYRK